MLVRDFLKLKLCWFFLWECINRIVVDGILTFFIRTKKGWTPLWYEAILKYNILIKGFPCVYSNEIIILKVEDNVLHIRHGTCLQACFFQNFTLKRKLIVLLLSRDYCSIPASYQRVYFQIKTLSFPYFRQRDRRQSKRKKKKVKNKLYSFF